jgi:Zn-dependent membrane protease YugP
LLLQFGITDVEVKWVRGRLTDHYDPHKNILGLSSKVFARTSLAALAVAAHEVGHVAQHYEGYAPLRLRSAFMPVAYWASNASWPIFLLGIVSTWQPLMWIGIGVFASVLVFYLAMLPVEFDASRRAVAALESGGFLTVEETRPVKRVLNAAGFTYVAAAIQVFFELLRLMVIALAQKHRD